jgi:hypothetical protein
MNKLHNLTIPTIRTSLEKGDRTSRAIEQAKRSNKQGGDRTSHTVAIEQLELTQGSALVITILVIAVISAIGFSVSRLSISQLRQTTQLEDSTVAYYASESGVEQGLLMWKYNHDVEVPNNVTGGMSQDVTDAFRVNMEDMATSTGDVKLAPEGNKKDSIYDLRIWYKNPNIGGTSKEVVCENSLLSEPTSECANAVAEGRPVTDTGAQPALEKNKVVEYDATGISQIYLRWGFEDDTFCMTHSDNLGRSVCLLEINFYPSGEKQFLEYNLRTGYNRALPTDTSKIFITAQSDNLKEYLISVSGADQKIPSRFSTIESTGYYGLAKRKLQIKIDRFSGTVFGPYGLIIYQGQ